MSTKLLRITAGFKRPFCCGVEISSGKVTVAAPIVRRWALGLTEQEFRKRCRLKAWEVEEVPLRETQEKG